jgi:hypothetical protein
MPLYSRRQRSSALQYFVSPRDAHGFLFESAGNTTDLIKLDRSVNEKALFVAYPKPRRKESRQSFEIAEYSCGFDIERKLATQKSI